jgi:hypothetical protein
MFVVVTLLSTSGVPRAQDNCLAGSDSVICLKYRGTWTPHCSPAGTKVIEYKFVCKAGTPNAGAGWDITCRSTDNKCNINWDEVCPQGGGLTQWNTDDHCTQTSGGGNWNPASGAKTRLKADYQSKANAKAVNK